MVVELGMFGCNELQNVDFYAHYPLLGSKGYLKIFPKVMELYYLESHALAKLLVFCKALTVYRKFDDTKKHKIPIFRNPLVRLAKKHTSGQVSPHFTLIHWTSQLNNPPQVQQTYQKKPLHGKSPSSIICNVKLLLILLPKNVIWYFFIIVCLYNQRHKSRLFYLKN